MGLEVSTRQAADFFDVTPRTIQLWAQAGCPKVRRNTWDLKVVMAWWLEHKYMRPAFNFEGDDLLQQLLDEILINEVDISELLTF